MSWGQEDFLLHPQSELALFLLLPKKQEIVFLGTGIREFAAQWLKTFSLYERRDGEVDRGLRACLPVAPGRLLGAIAALKGSLCLLPAPNASRELLGRGSGNKLPLCLRLPALPN